MGGYSLQALAIIVLVGGIAGWLAGLLMKGRGLGVLGNIVIGVLGAFVGGWLLGVVGVSIGGGLLGAVLTALLGAVVLLALIRIIVGR